jgi:hypothetical protein
MARTSSTLRPAGSVSSQSRYRLPGKQRAGVAASHGHHHVGGLDHLVGERLGELLGHVDAHLVHGGDDRRVYLCGGCTSR